MELNLMIDYIVQEVLKKIEENEGKLVEKRKGLIIVNGGTANLEQILLELEKIGKVYELEVVFSEAGREIVGEERFKNFHIKKDIGLGECNSLLQDKDIILLPLLTKSTCAKIAVGIRDNVPTYLISKAILAEKKIVAVYDSCRVKNDNEYGKQLNFNIKKLQSYGIVFLESKELSDYVLEGQNQEISSLKNKKIITATDIINMDNKRVLLSKDTIITTLAKEKAKEIGVIFEMEK